ncbi:MAG: hypothetical protein Kow00121_30360 [Elainellaceae cyanobacterium]
MMGLKLNDVTLPITFQEHEWEAIAGLPLDDYPLFVQRLIIQARERLKER